MGLGGQQRGRESGRWGVEAAGKSACTEPDSLSVGAICLV